MADQEVRDAALDVDGSDIAATINAALQRLRESSYQPCQHVVHPDEMARGGMAVCAACLQVIDLGPR